MLLGVATSVQVLDRHVDNLAHDEPLKVTFQHKNPLNEVYVKSRLSGSCEVWAFFFLN